jgi:hypothetical protein
MDNALDQNQTDPRHVLVASADEVLAQAHEQIKRADEQIARLDEQLSKLEHPSRRAGKRPLLVGQSVRGFIGLMLTAWICLAAFVWQSSYGDVAKQIITSWAPQHVPTPLPPTQETVEAKNNASRVRAP